MNAASEALGDCPLLDEDRTSSFEGLSAIASLVAAAAAASTKTNSPSREDEATSSTFYNDFAAI